VIKASHPPLPMIVMRLYDLPTRCDRASATSASMPEGNNVTLYEKSRKNQEIVIFFLTNPVEYGSIRYDEN